MLSGTVGSGCTDLTQATVHFVIVVSQQTQNYTLKEKSKYCFNPKEHWKTKGGGILFLSIFEQFQAIPGTVQ